MSIEELIEEIIKLEWHAFTNVENEGGRADCQDNWETFYIMRKSQYLCWPKELLESYMDDFEAANLRGWNLIAEKYARMEEYTSPERYEKIKMHLPELNEEQLNVINDIVKLQINWADEFYKNNPEIAKRGRPAKDNVHGMTSSETYLRGELSTYSLKTISLYRKWVADLKKKNVNLIEQIIINTIKLYNADGGN